MNVNAINPIAADVRDKTYHLAFEVSITANATPADKVHSSELPGVGLLRTEGKVSESDAIEDLSSDFTTAVDNSTGDSQFGILLDGSELANNGIDKVLKVTITEQTSLASSLSVSPAQSDYLTSGGNVAIDIAGTGLNLESESPTFLVEVLFREA